MRTALLCTACLLTGFTTVAVAVPPGWTWGAGNCGFPNTMTENSCRRCCMNGHIQGHLTLNEVGGCEKFCVNHNWPRFPRLQLALEWAAKQII